MKASAIFAALQTFPHQGSWEFVSRILSTGADSGFEHELCAGAVGTGAATEFSGFLRMFRELPTIDTILVNPRTEPVLENAATQYAVASALAHCASDSNFDRIRTYLDRMPTEFQALCVCDAIAAPACHSLHRGVQTAGRSEPPRSRLNHLSIPQVNLLSPKPLATGNRLASYQKRIAPSVHLR